MATARLVFLGGAGTITGSKYLVDLGTVSGPRRTLIDCGMFQGQKKFHLLNWSRFLVSSPSISDVLLTHAYMNHTGYLLRLVEEDFNGAIWGADSTLALAEIILRGSAFSQERDADSMSTHGFSCYANTQPLYRVGDAERTLSMLRTIEFARPLDLGDDTEATWTRAGHILGSSSIRLSTPDGSILFSGGLGRATHPVSRQREISEGADLVLVESTYGDHEHPDPVGPAHEVFAEAIRSTVGLGDSILTPAFAMDRAEVVLLALDEMLREERIPDVPMFVDSPMALSSLETYRARSQAGEPCEEVGGLRSSHLDLHEV